MGLLDRFNIFASQEHHGHFWSKMHVTIPATKSLSWRHSIILRNHKKIAQKLGGKFMGVDNSEARFKHHFLIPADKSDEFEKQVNKKYPDHKVRGKMNFMQGNPQMINRYSHDYS